MTRPRKLEAGEIRERIDRTPGWEIVEGKLHRRFEFHDFVQAFGFMSSMALVSEARNHHPDWSNVYRRVEIDLTTHDAGGITELDFEWAAAANRAFETFASGR